MTTFKLRIVTVDHCLVKPNSTFDGLYSDFSDRQTNFVPIIRIFGITGEGKKGCLHVHGYYPYLTIPFDDEKHINVNAYKKKLAHELNKYLSSTNTNYFRTRSSKVHNYVYKITAIRAIPFYGYHSSERSFLRIFFFNPQSVDKVRSLFDNQQVMDTKFQPYEAHIPYILKFFIDYNLYGMNYINVKRVQFRFMENNVYNSEKATTCEIEGDCVVSDILNRELMSTDGQNPGLKSMWDEERERHRNNLLSSQITPPSSQERECNEITSKENNYLMLLRNILSNYESFSKDDSSSPSRSYSTDDFADIMMSCIQFSPKKTTFTQEEVMEAINNLSQNETDFPASQSSVTSNTSRKSAKDFAVKFKEIHSQASTSQRACSSQASRDSYSVDDFVKIMVDLVKDDNSSDKPEVSQGSSNVAEAMMKCVNLQELSHISEENDDEQMNMEMSQMFSSSYKKTDPEIDDSGAQIAPLDLAASPASTVTEYYSGCDEAEDLDGHKHETHNRDSNEFVEIVCDCVGNECCDLCCDRRSDLCDCEGGQCMKIPQVDGAFDKCDGSCKTQLKHDHLSVKMSTVIVPVDSLDRVSVKRKGFTIPQLDGSTFEELSNKLRRPKRRPKLKYDPLPIWSDSNVLNHQTGKSRNIEASTSTEPPVCNGNITENGRISRNILGYNLKLSKSLNELTFEKMGRESVQIKKLTSNEIKEELRKSERNIFDSKDRKLFYQTELTGKEKLNHLLTLCKRFEVAVEGDDKQSEASDDTLVNEDIEELSPTNEEEKEGGENVLAKTINHSIARILNSSENMTNADDEDDDNFSSGTQVNVSDICFDDDDTQPYWKSESPKKEETTSLKSSQDSAKIIEEDQDCDVYTQANVSSSQEHKTSQRMDESSPLKSLQNMVNVFSNAYPEDGVYTQVPLCLSETNDTNEKSNARRSLKFSQNSDKVFLRNEDPDGKVFTQFPTSSSQESNNSQKSVERLSTGDGELSDGIVSFYGYDTTLTSPPSSLMGDFDSPSSPIVPKVFNYSLTSSTPLTKIKDFPAVSQKNTSTCAVGVQTHKSAFAPKIASQNSNNSIIEGALNSQGYEAFELSSIDESIDDCHNYQYLTVMSLELFTSVTGDLKPNPSSDAIRAVFYGVHRDIPEQKGKRMILGAIIVETDMTDFNSEESFDFNSVNKFRKHLLRSGFTKDDVVLSYATDELDLYFKLIEVMKTHDPDIVLGYEIETLSLGYLLERANTLNVQILVALSRVMDEKNVAVVDEETIKNYGVKITGRIVLNLWRVLMHEVTLNMYSYENVHYHVLHERVPCYTYRDLHTWFDDKLNCWRTMNYYLMRVEGCLRMLDKLNLVEQYSELARVFGIQFFEVLTRGSQFRVESMMWRTAKAHNYIMVSPSVQQKVHMRAPEFIALTMEPESNLYTDPVVVLDFQSLYPSIIIAHNYCYSTCLGRLEHFTEDSTFEFGCSSLYTSRNTLKQNYDNIHFSPNAVAFLKPVVRRGVLPQMLTEILETRVMVKNAMKENDKKAKPSKALNKLLNARQLGLKLIANVTYGYTGANYSGRMPCVEIADAIVSKGREALETAIDLVNSTDKWGGRVIYGDTDSLFILFRGCSKEEAFKRGQEIADTVTAMNPKPMKLKFEKVYMPCILQSKKRYVGYSYESINQKEPTLDAKGIETVRRDTCPVASKILEKALRILFNTLDSKEVKIYTQRQFQKILSGRLSNLQDFIFAREYRGSENYDPSARIPALAIARKLRAVDPRAEPLKHERVPFVIVSGGSDQRVIQLVRQPLEVIKNPTLRINAKYYIENIIIKVLNRNFNLIGVDVNDWYKDMPRKQEYQRSRILFSKQQNMKNTLITQYFRSCHCAICKEQINEQRKAAFHSLEYDLCLICANNYQPSALAVTEEIRDLEAKFGAIIKICQSCNGSNDIQQNCCSIDCPQLFRLAQTNMDLATIPYLQRLLDALSLRKSSLQF